MTKLNNNKIIVLTSGEPSGIGPDILIQLAQKKWSVKLVACIDPELLKHRAKQLGLELHVNLYLPYSKNIIQSPKTLSVLPIKLSTKVQVGKPNIQNSSYVINTLTRACNGCITGEFSALVTGPIHKKIINDAGISFIGHTEFLAKKSQIDKVVMMFISKKIRIALVTTHVPLKLVSQLITFEHLEQIICILNNELKSKFNIKNPNIYICGLNPHAGEGGYIGNEEIDIIIPVIKKLKNKGLLLFGPFSADTILQQKQLNKPDVILAMYHDQGLPILKYHNVHQAINITLGLPFIRTSVDHGTALKLAGTQQANPSSFINALKLAINMINSNE